MRTRNCCRETRGHALPRGGIRRHLRQGHFPRGRVARTSPARWTLSRRAAHWFLPPWGRPSGAGGATMSASPSATTGAGGGDRGKVMEAPLNLRAKPPRRSEAAPCRQTGGGWWSRPPRRAVRAVRPRRTSISRWTIDMQVTEIKPRRKRLSALYLRTASLPPAWTPPSHLKEEGAFARHGTLPTLARADRRNRSYAGRRRRCSIASPAATIPKRSLFDARGAPPGEEAGASAVGRMESLGPLQYDDLYAEQSRANFSFTICAQPGGTV